MNMQTAFPGVDAETLAEFRERLRDPWWRLTSGQLYWIMTKNNDDEEAVARFLPNAEQLEWYSSLHYRNLILKDRQRGFCVSPETRILTADMDQRAIADLRPGDEIVGTDEHPLAGRGQARSLRRATVLRSVSMKAERYRITLDDGRSLVCTDRHPWLTRKVGTETDWRSISGQGNAVVGKIKPGTRIRAITLPWDAPSYEDGWFGGLLDGEGSIGNAAATPRINVCQRPGAVFDRAQAYLARRGYAYRIEDDEAIRPSKHGSTSVPKLALSRSDEIIRLIGQTRPARFVNNPWWEGRTLPGKRSEAKVWFTVVEIEPIGRGDVVDLQTSTGTYIAEGFVSHNTTAGAIMLLDHALFVPDQRCGLIAHTEHDAKAIFRDKIKFAYERLPPIIKRQVGTARMSQEEILFQHNNSSVRVAVSMRSATIHMLHISEFGKIAAKHPERAIEIKTGALQAVTPKGIATIESTAEGVEGAFYDGAQIAQAVAESGRVLTPRDYRFHFSAWWTSREHVLDPDTVRVSPSQHLYFDKIEGTELFQSKRPGGKITAAQRAWYIATLESVDFANNQTLMFREYPSTPEECWQQSIEGAFYAEELAKARVGGRIVPHIPVVDSPCNTFWDIGNSDGTAIWVHQRVGMENRLIRFVEDWGQSYSHFILKLQALNLIWGKHYLPHDAGYERQGETKPFKPIDTLQKLAPTWKFEIVPRVSEFGHGIQAMRSAFPTFWFDETECKEGIKHLTLYRKRRIEATGYWMNEPVKNVHTEAADALRQLAQTLPTINNGTGRRVPRRQGTKHLS